MKLICFIIQQSGYTIEYIYSLEQERFFDLIQGFVELINPEASKQNSVSDLEAFHLAHQY